MTGKLSVVGLGPGPQDWLTPAARGAIACATDIVGYSAYTDRLAVSDGQRIHASDNRVELDRARYALQLATQGATVAVVSGGDPGVFAMAAAIFEAIEAGPDVWRNLDIIVEPGVTAMLAAAARVGAPLGHDFCAISLSDNLKPWATIEHRLRCAADGGFVIALYNPASKSRPHQIHDALAILAAYRAAHTPVVLARAVGRPDEDVTMTTLADAANHVIDMRTLVLIGSSATRYLLQDGKRRWIYTPRFSDGAT